MNSPQHLAQEPSRSRRFASFAWGVLAYNLAVVAWGAWVRVTGSGAGCGEHWPDCNGEVIPRDPSVETIIEFTHRATSGIALLLVVGMVVAAWRIFDVGHRVRHASVIALVFMIAEALLGAGLVIFGLVGDNASPARAIVMSVHLVNTFFLLGGVALAARWASSDAPIDLKHPRMRWLLVGAGLIFAVGVTGAIAALGDTLFPAKSLAEGIAADFSPTAHFLLRLRTLHPIVAILCAGALWFMGSRWPSPAGRRMQWLVVTQIVAGFVNLALLAPGWMQLLHLVLADIVWIAFLLFAVVSIGEEPTEKPGASHA